MVGINGNPGDKSQGNRHGGSQIAGHNVIPLFKSEKRTAGFTARQRAHENHIYPGDLPQLALEDGLSSLASACKAKKGNWGPDVVEVASLYSPSQQGILLSRAEDDAPDPNAAIRQVPSCAAHL
ncbi:hypothetical protein FVEG_14013 [Fusarium verticillioides 7600]|uniref:Uncharacterized protein n=1 Tax=Gibberella moniliformis (strain M3125 / FGSC 7600) TaxID=334819 RepID=A0A139YC26_GIBM7|nr:hypothetical protein FVEG_14013 [Fusarium verticillioides 7600]KYG13773.1 hypothetical protein FVEG_14013 [Fusarium verticillioides 7600]